MSDSELGLDHRENLFDLEKKRLFLEGATKHWPNIGKICRMIGIHRSSYYNHLKKDPVFAAQVEEVRQQVTDHIEEVLATEAVKPKSFLDRMAYLRAYRPELYDRAKVVKIEGYKMTDEQRASRVAGLEGAIDAEIVKTYSDRKQIQEQRRLSADEKRAEQTSGEGGGSGK